MTNYNFDDVAVWRIRKGKDRHPVDARLDRPEDDDPTATRLDMHIYESDVQRILSVKNHFGRVMAFVITAFCDMWGFCNLGAAKFAKYANCTSPHIIDVQEQNIEAAGLFTVIRGRAKRLDSGRLSKAINQYRFPADYVRGGRCFEISETFTPANAEHYYLRAMAELADDALMREHMSPKEYQAMAEVRRCADGSADTDADPGV